MRVTLMRHLPTKYNLSCVFIGREDLDCDINYINQHSAEISYIKNSLKNLNIFYCSPLKRALQSMSVITDCKDIIIDDRLIERDLGLWSNVRKDHLRELYPEAFYSNGRLKFSYTPTGGEDFSQLILRICSFLIDAFEQHSNDSIAIMTHNGVITTIKCLMAKNLYDTSIHGFQPYLQPYTININPETIMYLKTIIDPQKDPITLSPSTVTIS